MIKPEGSGETFANPNQLQALYWVMRTWLSRNGVYIEEASDKDFGPIHGVRIGEHPSFYNLKVPGDVARSVIPEAAATLAIGSLIEVDFQPAYHTVGRRTNSRSYTASMVSFAISRTPPAVVINESLWISGPDAKEPWASDRTQELGEHKTVKSMLDAWELEHELGTHKITASEFGALADIAAHLDKLQEESL